MSNAIRTIITSIILCVFSINIHSQSIDYNKLSELIIEDPTASTVEKLQVVIEYYDKEAEAKQLITTVAKYKEIRLVKVKDKRVFYKCKNFATSIEYYTKIYDEALEGQKDDKKMMYSASTEYMRDIYRQRYNNSIDRLGNYSDKINTNISEYRSCNDSQQRNSDNLFNKKDKLIKELFELYIYYYR